MTMVQRSTATDGKPTTPRRPRASAVYTSRIIKAGALIGDTKTLLSQWDVTATVAQNLQRLQSENVFGKASRSRVADILAIFRKRYLADESVTRALAALVHRRFPAAALDRLFYFHSARADRLLHDAATEILPALQARGISEIGVADMERPIRAWIDAGKTSAPWGPITLNRVACELLAALRDFGVLQGASRKRIAPAFLPAEAFAYVAYYLKQQQPSGAKLIGLPDWRLFFLNPDAVERFLFEAHQRHLLEYHVAGSVSRLTFPAQTLEEYAHVLTQR